MPWKNSVNCMRASRGRGSAMGILATMRPRLDPITTTRSLRKIASSMSWVIKRTEVFEVDRSCCKDMPPRNASYGGAVGGGRLLVISPVSGSSSLQRQRGWRGHVSFQSSECCGWRSLAHTEHAPTAFPASGYTRPRDPLDEICVACQTKRWRIANEVRNGA